MVEAKLICRFSYMKILNSVKTHYMKVTQNFKLYNFQEISLVWFNTYSSCFSKTFIFYLIFKKYFLKFIIRNFRFIQNSLLQSCRASQDAQLCSKTFSH